MTWTYSRCQMYLSIFKSDFNGIKTGKYERVKLNESFAQTMQWRVFAQMELCLYDWWDLFNHEGGHFDGASNGCIVSGNGKKILSMHKHVRYISYQPLFDLIFTCEITDIQLYADCSTLIFCITNFIIILFMIIVEAVRLM